MKKYTRIVLVSLLSFIVAFGNFQNVFGKTSNAETLKSKLNQFTNEKNTITNLFKNPAGSLFKSQVKTNSAINDLPSILLGFTPTDTVMDTDRPIIYMTDGANNKLYSVNYNTGEIKSIQLDLKPETLTYSNNEVYVSLLKTGHHYWTDLPLQGAIAIINADSFTKVDQIDINQDPFDIQVDNQGYIYIASGSNQWSNLGVYSRQTKQQVSLLQGFDYQSFIHLQPNTSKIYSIPTDTYPCELTVYSFLNGVCQDSYGSPYHGNYTMNVNMRISPDGKYIFNGSGNVFVCSNTKGTDMTYYNKLNSAFTDIAFNLNSNLIYTAQKDGNINVYRYNDLTQVGTLSTEGTVQNVYYNNNKLLSVSKLSNNTFILERKTLCPTPQTTPTIVDTYPNSNVKTIAIQDTCGVGFDKNIILNNANITLTNSNTNQQVTIKNAGALDDIIYVSYANLAYSTRYTLTIAKGSISDYAGNVYNNDITLSFTTGDEYSRLSGIDRYATSIKITQNYWAKANYVVLATGEDYPDALCAAPLAAKYEAPLLLTPSKTLDPGVEQEIDRLQPKKIFIIGGTGAISAAIEQKINSKGIATKRICGLSRYDTSLEIAKYLGNSPTVFVVTGENYPDALSIASCAAYYEVPILLTQATSLPSNTQAYIKSSGVTSSYIIGGSGVVSDTVLGSLPKCTRIAGNNRYETNFNVLSYFKFDFTNAFIATGENFADALSGSSPAGLMHSPIILTDNNMPQNVVDNLRYNKDLLKMKIILGGTGAVSDNIISRIFK